MRHLAWVARPHSASVARVARVLVCRLSPKRLALLRDAPQLLRELRAAIREGDVPGALDLGALDLKRRSRLAARLGPAAWAEASRFIDGEAGDALGHGARLLAPEDIAHVVTSMIGEATPGRARSVEATADALRRLLRDAYSNGESVLVIAATAAARRAARVRLAARDAGRCERVEAACLGRSELDDVVLRVALWRPHTGLRHPDAAERRGSFHDLRDRLFETSTRHPRRLAVEVIRELVILWASVAAHPDSRRLAALLLGELGEAVERGGPCADEVRAALRTNLGELRSYVEAIAAETDPQAQAAIARACAVAALQL